MEINDVFEEAVQDTKQRILKLKKIIFVLVPVGLLIGILGGIGQYQSDLEFNNSIDSSTGPLSGYILTTAFQGAVLPSLILIALVVLYSIFWFPSAIAKRRGHAYVSLIQVLNIAGLFTVVTWFIALAWAIFPSEKSLIDPVVGNPTGLGRRNAGDTIGAAKQGSNRGQKFEKNTDKELDALIDMRTKGLISDEEFARKKREILQREY
jgi:hypothetical protein